MRKNILIDSDMCHDTIVKEMQPKLGFNKDLNFVSWKKDVLEKFTEIIGMKSVLDNSCPLNFEIEWEEDKGDYKLIRFTVDSEVGETVPCYLTIPKLGKEKYPVVIVLQGHDGAINCSIGEPKNEEQEKFVSSGGDFAVQVAKNGCVGLAVELRGIGEKQPISENRSNDVTCRWATRTAFFLQRTIVAERIVDIMKSIDALSNFSVCDLDKIAITGNEIGGVTAFYTACLDERIKLCAPNGGFCNFADSLFVDERCGCYYIPYLFEQMDMQDLSCLVSPRDLLILAPEKDKNNPLESVKKSFEIAKSIFSLAGAKENCNIVTTPSSSWDKEAVWQALNNKFEKLGW